MVERTANLGAQARPHAAPATPGDAAGADVAVRPRTVRVGADAQRARRLAALNEAALAIAGDLDLDRVLEKILKTAAKLIGARYGALGIPDGRGGFGRFLTVGISEQRADRIGALPRVHGVLGALVSQGKPIRSRDIRRHPDFSAYPADHPEMIEF